MEGDIAIQSKLIEIIKKDTLILYDNDSDHQDNFDNNHDKLWLSKATLDLQL